MFFFPIRFLDSKWIVGRKIQVLQRKEGQDVSSLPNSMDLFFHSRKCIASWCVWWKLEVVRSLACRPRVPEWLIDLAMWKAWMISFGFLLAIQCSVVNWNWIILGDETLLDLLVYFSGRMIMMHFVNAEVFLLVYDLQIELLTITIDNDGPLACYDSKLWKSNYRYWARENPLPLSETFFYSHGGLGRKLEPSSSLCWSLFKRVSGI